MSKSVLSRKTTKWTLLLQEFDITFVPQKAIKRQAVADFLVDHLAPNDWKLSEDFPDEDAFFIEFPRPRKLFFNGAAQTDGAGAGVIFVTPKEEILLYAFTLTERCSNNKIEYKAIILGLEMAVELQIYKLEVFGDPKLIINKILKLYEVKKPELLPYAKYAEKLLEKFDEVS